MTNLLIPITNDKNVTLFVPTGEDTKLMDINSFNRILGELWISGEKLTDILLEKKYGELIDH